jgi:hypothetical protein
MNKGEIVMRVIVLVVVILSVYTPPATAYEVIFHQVFEGEQFPPAGWEAYGDVVRFIGGYESEWCACLNSFYESQSSFISVEIPINPGELYEFRIHACAFAQHDGIHYAEIRFDNGYSASLGLPSYPSFEGYDWTLFSIQESTPSDASTVHFFFTCQSFGMMFGMSFSIDNVSIIHTATGITPASLGRVKAAYR